MKLYLTGHDYKYAVEQIMLALFPEERPEYIQSIPDVEQDFTSVALSRSEKYATASVTVKAEGKKASGFARVRAAALDGKLASDRELQKIIKLAFYRAAEKMLPEMPVWGALTGVRPGVIFTKLLKSGMSEKRAKREMEKTFFLSSERAQLCAETAKASLETDAALEERDVALYIGIPFCPTRCAYCSFVSQSVERSMSLIPPFMTALDREMEAVSETVRRLGLRVISVYVGGGTPTTLPAEELARMGERLHELFDLSAMREFCVEAGRPDTITEEKLKALQNSGVTRVSINPQSMDDSVLTAIGRRHTAEDIRRAYDMTRRYFFGDVNMDLIAGLPADSPESFRRTLNEVIAMEPENVTVHTLSLKKGTRITLEGTAVPGKREVGEMLDFAMTSLREADFMPYYLYRQKFMSGGFENVGWSQKGHESLYNIFIMEELGTILAMGGGASTKLVNRGTGRIERVFNPKYPKEYIETIDNIIAQKAKIEEFYGSKM